MRWVLFFKKLAVFFVRGGYSLVGIFLCVFQKVGAIYAEFFCIFQQGGYVLKRCFWYFGFKVGGSSVSHILSLFPPFLYTQVWLWKVFNHDYLLSALVLFTNWLSSWPLCSAGGSLILVLSCLVYCFNRLLFFRRSSYLDTSSLVRRAVAPLYKDVYTIYVTMLKSIHTSCQICAFCTLKFM